MTTPTNTAAVLEKRDLTVRGKIRPTLIRPTLERNGLTFDDVTDPVKVGTVLVKLEHRIAVLDAENTDLRTKLTATSGDSVAGLVREFPAYVQPRVVKIESNNAKLYRYPDEYVVSKDTYIIHRGTDEPAAVRAFRAAAGLGEEA